MEPKVKRKVIRCMLKGRPMFDTDTCPQYVSNGSFLTSQTCFWCKHRG